jgi:Cu2+-exporting ATPase
MEEIQAGDHVAVHAGEVIAIAGTIVAGRAWIDMQALTGETQPVAVGEGDEVAVSSLVRGGEIILRAALSGVESRAQNLEEVLRRTRDFKDQLTLRGEAWSDAAAMPIMGVSALTWLAAGLTPATALLFSAPMNSGRATLALQTSTHLRWAADHGILVKDGRALEELPRVDTILFDKTGTLTEHTPEVAAVLAFGDVDEARLLALAAAAEGHVNHPVADAIRGQALAMGVAIPPVGEIAYDLGAGVRASVAGLSLHLGSLGYMRSLAIESPTLLTRRIAAHPQHTYILLAINGELAGAIELRAKIRGEAAGVLEALRQLGKGRLAIVSGDTRLACAGIGEALGMDEIHAEINPDGKAALIRELQRQGRRVCFVGDGLNDAVAMKQANVSICMSDGANLTGNVAHIQLTGEGLAALPGAFRFGMDLQRRLGITLKYWIAFGGINTLAVPLLAFTPLQSSLFFAVAVGGAFYHVRSVPTQSRVKVRRTLVDRTAGHDG